MVEVATTTTAVQRKGESPSPLVSTHFQLYCAISEWLCPSSFAGKRKRGDSFMVSMCFMSFIN